MTVTLYTRRGCHLCDEAKQAIDSARRRSAFEYQEFDIDADPKLLEMYNEEVPVITIDGARATVEELRRRVS
jgi:glutaredoxin